MENPPTLTNVDQPRQSEASIILNDAEIFRYFLKVLKASLKIEGKDAYKMVKMIRDENGPEELSPRLLFLKRQSSY